MGANQQEELRQVFCREFVRLAERDKRMVFLDADLMASDGMARYLDALPGQIFNCGIQEANMAGVAAGLSAAGMIPFIHSFGAFASRRMFDQIFLSCAYAGLTVNIVGSDPGIVASYNGGTHMALEDVALMRTIPKAVIVEPADRYAMEQTVRQLSGMEGVHYLRLARKQMFTLYGGTERFTVGKAVCARPGGDVTLVAAGGVCLREAMDAAQTLQSGGVCARVLDMFTVKPLDREAVLAAARETEGIVTVENHNVCGGLGSAVAEVLAEEGIPARLTRLGVRERFGEVGSVEDLVERMGISSGHIVRAALSLLKKG